MSGCVRAGERGGGARRLVRDDGSRRPRRTRRRDLQDVGRDVGGIQVTESNWMTNTIAATVRATSSTPRAGQVPGGAREGVEVLWGRFTRRLIRRALR